MGLVVPSFEPVALVASDPALAARISSCFRAPGSYLPVFSPPWGPPPNDKTSQVHTTNAISRSRVGHLVLAGIEERLGRDFAKGAPAAEVISVGSFEEFRAFDIVRVDARRVLHWGPQRLSIGLLKAKLEDCTLVLDLAESPPEDTVSTDSEHLIICEDSDDLIPIMAANYAYALGASLQLVSQTTQSQSDAVARLFVSAAPQEGRPSVDAVRELVGAAVPKPSVAHSAITFFTRGIPWGVFHPDVPTTHLLRHPLTGVNIANAIHQESDAGPGTCVALLVDPHEVGPSEVAQVGADLSSRGTRVKALEGHNATVESVDVHVRHFPYDALWFSTHAGELSGKRMTFAFVDASRNRHQVICDIAFSHGLEVADGQVKVFEMMRFVTVDDVPWEDKQRVRDLGLADVLSEFLELRRAAHPSVKTVAEEPVTRIDDAMALRMSDGNLLFANNALGDMQAPVVVNNSCSSWHVMCVGFLFAGARSYVGTVQPVLSAEAVSFAEELFRQTTGEGLASDLWRAQRAMYDTQRRPYVLFGPHICRLSPPRRDPSRHLLEQLARAAETWTRRHEADPENEMLRRAAEFCMAELEKVRAAE